MNSASFGYCYCCHWFEDILAWEDFNVVLVTSTIRFIYHDGDLSQDSFERDNNTPFYRRGDECNFIDID